MGLLGLVGFAFQRFHVLAWPLFALVYPLCSSIKAIETNSITDTHKINTYWVVFSLILLFENAFMKPLEWFLLWPYIRLLIVFFLVLPHFDGALYVYKHLICPCLSLDPQIVINLLNKRKESLARDNFLSEVERYVKENGPEGLEKFIACKSTRTNLNVKESNAVSSMDNEASKSIKPNGGQNDIKAVQVMVKKKETTASQVSQAEPNLTVNEDKFSSRKMNEKAIGAAADREILNTPPPKKVQKEWTTVSPLPTQTDATFNSPLGDNKHKATYEALKIKNEAEPKLTWPESSTVAAMEIYEKPVEVGTVIEDPEPPKEVQKEWTCALCQVTTACERNMNSHLQGRKHKAAYEALKAGNQTSVPKIAPASTAKTSNQPNKEPGKSIRSTGKLNWPEIHTVSFMELFEKPVEFGTVIEDPEPPKVVQKEWTCALCQVATACERNMNSHLQGRKHKAAYEALKAGNQAFVPKIAPASTAKTSNQPNKEPGKSIPSSGSEQKVTVNENVQGQKNSSPPPITKKHYKPKEQLADGVSSNGQKGKIAIHVEKVQSQQPKPNEVPRVKSSPMRCKICGVCCSDEIDLLSHLNGKKHQENVQEYLIREWMKKPRGLCDTETGEFDIYW